jgi:hypothetical protein
MIAPPLRVGLPPLSDFVRWAAGKFNYLAKKVNDLIYSQAAFTSVTPIFYGLSTAAFDNTKTGATIAEATYTSYARVSITNNATNFPAATGSGSATKTGSAGGAITWPQNTGSGQTMLSAFTADASTTGNLYHGADITSTTINASDTPQINTNGFTNVES